MNKIRTNHNFILRGLPISEIREYAKIYTGLQFPEISKLDRNELIQLLILESEKDNELRQELKSKELSFRPSFFLLNILYTPDFELNDLIFLENLKKEFNIFNNYVQGKNKNPPRKKFIVSDYKIKDGKYIFQLNWNRIHWYWSPDEYKLRHIFELKIGYIILDFNINKAMIICQNQNERDIIAKSISKAIKLDIKPIILTKPILEQIGTFDHVKKAGYFNSSTEFLKPKNITYSDENLSSIPLVIDEENDTTSIRKLSFYQIPLNTIENQGVGVNSDSGKLWIPKNLPLSTVLDYGIQLLDRIRNSFTELCSIGKQIEVIKAYGIENIEEINAITPIIKRNQIIKLIIIIANMILSKENERQFSLVDNDLLCLIPDFFQNAHLQLISADTGEVGYFINKDNGSIQIQVKKINNDFHFFSLPTNEEIDLSRISHPYINNFIPLTNNLNCIELFPTLHLTQLILRVLISLSNEFVIFRTLQYLNFYISNGRIIIDLAKVLNKSLSFQNPEILPNQLSRLSKPLMMTISETQRKRLSLRLRKLKEQCVNKSDENCQDCVNQKKFLCIRSLIGSYFDNTILYSHKSTELTDFQGEAYRNDTHEKIRYFGFAKIAKNGNLTARNSQGAILFSQVMCQIRNSSMQGILIISPSIINEDLRNNFLIIAELINKKITFLNATLLEKVLADFEIQADMDKLDIKRIYRDSSSN